MNFSLSTLGKREMMFVYIALLLISGGLLYYLIVSPELGHYLSARSQYHSQQQKEMRMITQRDALIQEYLVLREKADQVQKLIFTRREAEDFLEMLPKLSQQTKNYLTSITPKGSTPIVQQDPNVQRDEKKPSPLDEIAQIPVYATITGLYGDIISLFRALEGYKQLMAISDVSVNSSPDNPSQVASSFSLNLIHLKSAIKQPSNDMLAAILSGSQVAMAPEAEPAEPEEAAQLAATKLGTEDVTVKPPEADEKKLTPGKRKTPEKRKAGEYVKTVRYSVKVSAPNLEQNLKEIKNLMLTRNYEAWMLPFPSTSSRSSQYNLIAGKFGSMEEADKFGKLMQKQLPWASKYEIIEGEFDYDVILREHRTLKKSEQ